MMIVVVVVVVVAASVVVIVVVIVIVVVVAIVLVDFLRKFLEFIMRFDNAYMLNMCVLHSGKKVVFWMYGLMDGWMGIYFVDLKYLDNPFCHTH